MADYDHDMEVFCNAEFDVTGRAAQIANTIQDLTEAILTLRQLEHSDTHVFRSMHYLANVELSCMKMRVVIDDLLEQYEMNENSNGIDDRIELRLHARLEYLKTQFPKTYQKFYTEFNPINLVVR